MTTIALFHSVLGVRQGVLDAAERLRQPERLVLDTLVAAGVARSRSEALAWSVRLVGSNAEAWLGELREAMQQVEQVRAQGPDRTE